VVDLLPWKAAAREAWSDNAEARRGGSSEGQDMRHFGKRGVVLGVLGSVLVGAAPLTAAPLLVGEDGGAISLVAGTTVSDWAAKVWSAAMKGDQAELDKLLSQCPASTGKYTECLELLKTHLVTRENKRGERLEKVSKKLDEQLAKATDDLNISMALQSAIEMSMLSKDKQEALNDGRVKELVGRTEKAAKAAEGRGDWLTANDLYYRLDLLLEEHGTYKDDVRRETQRLSMIRLYAPERLWELRNIRRNAEIEWRKANPTDPKEDDEAEGDEGEKVNELQPLPPYNPMGDSYKEKLAGIDKTLVLSGIARAYAKHVERVEMSTILRTGLEAVKTLVTTDDLHEVFPDLADEGARAELVRFVEEESGRLDNAGPSDLMTLTDRLLQTNERTVKLPREALLHEFGNGAMSALDEFSSIIWPDEIRRFNKSTQGKFVGVGIQIEMDPLYNIKVVTPLDGTPASRAGVRPGDLIKRINDQSTEGFTIDQAVDVITGPINTPVKLTVERQVTKESGETEKVEIDYQLTRAEIEEATVKGWRRSGKEENAWDWYIDQDNKIGYVRLTKFAERTDAEFDRAIDQMKEQGLTGMILDLRYNPGGLLEQAVAITSRFVDREQAHNFGGNVVTTHTKDGMLHQTEKAEKGRARLAGLPVVVLVNEGSASASEIVSGALQDYATAGDAKVVVMGGRSYGKGSVQNVWGLGGNNAAIKVTTQYYHLPGGRMIHKLPAASEWGVEPNLKVEMLPSQMAEALIHRQNADLPQVEGEARAEKAANPDDLLSKGMDLQLSNALLLLQAQAIAAKDPERVVQKP
jgi:carboxyl-terminal processing protease